MCDQLKKLWKVWLGIFLAVLMLISNLSHSIDLHLDHDDSHEHFAEQSKPDKSSDSRGTDHHSGSQSHAAIHHCHGANCYFLMTNTIPDVVPPVVCDFLLSSLSLLRFSFGIDGEEIDPPRV